MVIRHNNAQDPKKRKQCFILHKHSHSQDPLSTLVAFLGTPFTLSTTELLTNVEVDTFYDFKI